MCGGVGFKGEWNLKAGGERMRMLRRGAGEVGVDLVAEFGGEGGEEGALGRGHGIGIG